MLQAFMKLALAVLIAVFVSGCQGSQKPKIYVGMNAEFAPFEYRKGGEILGFDVDLIREIAKIADFEIKILDIRFDGLLPALGAGKIDLIISGMTATEDRRKFVDFSLPYYEATQAVLVHQDDEAKIKELKDLEGRKVGVVLGFVGEILVNKMQNVHSQSFNAASEVVLALKSKKVDAVVMDYETAKSYAKQNAELRLVKMDFELEEYAIAMRKGSDELLEKINQAIIEIKQNGVYDRLVQKYFE